MALPSNKTPRDLLRLLILPLVDGYFLSMVVSGRLDHWNVAVLVGLLAFSGAGVVTTASLLPHTATHWRGMTFMIARVYLIILPTAWLATLLMGPLQAIELPYQGIFTALILLGTAANMWPTSLPHKVRGLYKPPQMVAILISVMIIYGLESHRLLPLHFQFNPLLFAMVTLSVGVGFLLTLAGSLLQWKWGGLDTPLARNFLAAGGSIVLFMVSLSLLGVPVPGLWIWSAEGLALFGAVFITRLRPKKQPL
ncbi:MAG: hypothetical protein C7B44_05835 [Sulfobacillus thermosulfidooxidans]|uniref:Uncharacterized protein n=1 Tax=Sulfobacillus thermotolerans TaxID=338644 RepID=A0ABM6RTR6_9FIRM|nr:hypothetical protein [Sulfobacillus sp. hq2]AUW94824.1 hypothetical protein BXT84_13415 [Sulfobacillus thermotolerans]MCY0906806.1 hypothetical protein [Sulfobacillus thermotolerans]POB09825.1 hypothetical protein CO251_13060 [Sulfobacillus sp. hq2]PSR37047.1 MAG: hypothetical protein C7B44_05835 [Sulfobacillus thermosulfidooxidans]